jgi:chromosome segregation ATPase
MMKRIGELKAEVEHLQSELKMEKENEDRLVREWQKANNEVYGLQRQVAALIDDQTRLKAEVERLTKAGDEMALNLTHIGWNICVEAWHAAKEGKQS